MLFPYSECFFPCYLRFSCCVESKPTCGVLENSSEFRIVQFDITFMCNASIGKVETKIYLVHHLSFPFGVFNSCNPSPFSPQVLI